MNGVQNQVDRLLGVGFVGLNAVVLKAPDHEQVQYALLGVDVGDAHYPFAVGPVHMKVPIEQILVFKDLLLHLLPFLASPNLR